MAACSSILGLGAAGTRDALTRAIPNDQKARYDKLLLEVEKAGHGHSNALPGDCSFLPSGRGEMSSVTGAGGALSGGSAASALLSSHAQKLANLTDQVERLASGVSDIKKLCEAQEKRISAIEQAQAQAQAEVVEQQRRQQYTEWQGCKDRQDRQEHDGITHQLRQQQQHLANQLLVVQARLSQFAYATAHQLAGAQGSAPAPPAAGGCNGQLPPYAGSAHPQDLSAAAPGSGVASNQPEEGSPADPKSTISLSGIPLEGGRSLSLASTALNMERSVSNLSSSAIDVLPPTSAAALPTSAALPASPSGHTYGKPGAPNNVPHVGLPHPAVATTTAQHLNPMHHVAVMGGLPHATAAVPLSGAPLPGHPTAAAYPWGYLEPTAYPSQPPPHPPHLGQGALPPTGPFGVHSPLHAFASMAQMSPQMTSPLVGAIPRVEEPKVGGRKGDSQQPGAAHLSNGSQQMWAAAARGGRGAPPAASHTTAEAAPQQHELPAHPFAAAQSQQMAQHMAHAAAFAHMQQAAQHAHFPNGAAGPTLGLGPSPSDAMSLISGMQSAGHDAVPLVMQAVSASRPDAAAVANQAGSGQGGGTGGNGAGNSANGAGNGGNGYGQPMESAQVVAHAPSAAQQPSNLELLAKLSMYSPQMPKRPREGDDADGGEGGQACGGEGKALKAEGGAAADADAACTSTGAEEATVPTSKSADLNGSSAALSPLDAALMRTPGTGVTASGTPAPTMNASGSESDSAASSGHAAEGVAASRAQFARTKSAWHAPQHAATAEVAGADGQ